jgi:hypothetical protein
MPFAQAMREDEIAYVTKRDIDRWLGSPDPGIG